MGFCIIKIADLVGSSDPRNGNLISFNDVLLDTRDKISSICDNELKEEFDLAFENLGKLFDGFPALNNELICQSYMDVRSPYYNEEYNVNSVK